MKSIHIQCMYVCMYEKQMSLTDNYVLTYLKWTIVFKWCVVRLGFKKKHQKDICLEDI